MPAQTTRVSGEGVGWFGILQVWAQALTYLMALIRWIATDHFSFWHGFKELLWVLCPILNFGYVWDWWLVVLRIAIQALVLAIRASVVAFGFASQAANSLIAELIAGWIPILVFSIVIGAIWALIVIKERRHSNPPIRK